MSTNFVRLDQFDPSIGFKSKRSKFIFILWYFVKCFFFLTPFPWPSFLKACLLRAFGARVGLGLVLKPRVNIHFPWNLVIGDHVWIGEGAWIDNLDSVIIGDHCCVSQGALLICGNHDYTKITFDLVVKPIVLEDGVWIGAKSVVCPGVVARTHAILTAGSTISKDMQAYSIYRGNPAEKVKSRDIKE